MDKPPEISLYGYHSFLLCPFPRFLLFSIFFHPCFGRTPTPKAFPLACWLYKRLYGNSWASMLPTPHLCIHTHLDPKKLWYLLQRPLWNILTLVLLQSCSVFNHKLRRLQPLPPALVKFLYLLCVNTAHTHKCAHGQPHCVFTRASIEACRWFKHCKHVLNGCLLHSVGDVIPC